MVASLCTTGSTDVGFLKDRLSNVSTHSRELPKACLTHNHIKHSRAEGVERPEFYKDVNWKEDPTTEAKFGHSDLTLLLRAAACGAPIPPIDPLLWDIREAKTRGKLHYTRPLKTKINGFLALTHRQHLNQCGGILVFSFCLAIPSLDGNCV